MRNIYGTRSIIPNNYYFTFDKIYDNEAAVKGASRDSVLIGRAVLAQQERTVWLKTNNGYLKVAKLDNEGRFIYSEGYSLQNSENIDTLNSKGNTFNDDGCYLVDTRQHPDIAGTFPTVTGIKNTTDDSGNTIEEYKKNSFFVLNQFSEEAPKEFFKQVTETDKDGTITSQTNAEAAQRNGVTLYKKDTSTNSTEATFVPAVELSIDAKTVYYILDKAIIPVYQVIHDLTGAFDEDTENTIAKIDSVETNTGTTKADITGDILFHYGKTLIRKGYQVFQSTKDNIEKKSSDTSTDKDYNNLVYHEIVTTTDKDKKETKTKKAEYYTYDKGAKKFKGGATINPNGDSFYKEVFWGSCTYTDGNSEVTLYNLGTWVDESEHYTGYLGNLNATQFNHTNTVYDPKEKNLLYEQEGSETRESLHDRDGKKYITLVDAINQLDRVIGSTNERFKGIEGIINDTKDNGYSPKAKNVAGMSGDARHFNIKQNNLADAIIVHDADIGQLGKELTSDYTYNLNFTNTTWQTSTEDYKGNEGSNLGPEDTDISQINSLTGAIKKLDDILGYQGRLHQLNNNNAAVNASAVSTGKAQQVTNVLTDKRKYNIPEANVIDALIHHDADIGFIEKINTDNTYNLNFNEGQASIDGGTHLDNTDGTDNERTSFSEINSLTGAIKKLDDILGYQGRLNFNTGVGTAAANSGKARLVTGLKTNESDKRQYNIPETNVIDALVHHDADIGQIENINTKNTYNLKFTTDYQENEGTNLNSEEIDFSQINSLTGAIKKLDNVLGSQSRLGCLGNDKDVYVIAAADDNKQNTNAADDARKYNIPESNVIDALIHHDADIGSLETELNTTNTYNLLFTSSSNIGGEGTNLDNTDISNTDRTHASNINSLTGAIKKLDDIIGTQLRLGDKQALNSYPTSVDEDDKAAKSMIAGDSRSAYIAEYNIIDALAHKSADIGDIAFTNIHQGTTLKNLVFNNKDATESIAPGIDKDNNKYKYQSIADAIVILDKLLGSIITLSSKNNFESNSDITTALETLDNLIGAWVTTGWYEKWDGKSETVSEKPFDTIVVYLQNINEWLKTLTENKEDKASMDIFKHLINNLAENMDILDINLTSLTQRVNNLANYGDLPSLGNGGGSITWGTF